jgi:hypothetical protein
MPTLGQEHIHLITANHTGMTEMRGEGDPRIEHAALDLGGEFFALFDASAEETNSGFEGG